MIVLGTVFMLMAVFIVSMSIAVAAVFFMMAVTLWFFKEAIEIDPENKRFRKVLVFKKISIGKWFPMEDVKYSSALKMKDSDKWSVNLHLTPQKYYRLFTTGQETAKNESAKINEILDDKS